MILLVFVAVLWVVVLAPSALRRIRERGGVGSVDHFHHQLELLEHAGPKMVTPAYRLRSAGSVSGADLSTPASSRPKLVLLRAVDDAQAADIDGVDGAHYARVGVIDRPEPPLSPAQTHAELAAYRRQQARQRCTFVLRLLAATAVTTGIIGALACAPAGLDLHRDHRDCRPRPGRAHRLREGNRRTTAAVPLPVMGSRGHDGRGSRARCVQALTCTRLPPSRASPGRGTRRWTRATISSSHPNGGRPPGAKCAGSTPTTAHSLNPDSIG